MTRRKGAKAKKKAGKTRKKSAAKKARKKSPARVHNSAS